MKIVVVFSLLLSIKQTVVYFVFNKIFVSNSYNEFVLNDFTT